MKYVGIRHIPILATIIIAALAPVAINAAGSKQWEPVKTERIEAKSVAKDTDLEIKAANSTIIVTTNTTVQIKVFTILGRLVNSETIGAGTSQLTLPAHGVYLVKVGGLTCKVAV